jgi:hypothetical protein
MAANPQTAIAVINPADSWEPKTLEILGQYPAAKFNVLVPTVSLRQVNPYLVPDIEAVQLDANPDNGDIYHDPQMKDGHYGPTKVGLRKLAQVAGITTISSRRIDDGSDADYIEWQVEIEMVQPSGRPIRGLGSKQIDLRPAAVKGKTPAFVARAHEHMVANAESKALNRAIRSILSLRPSYPQAVIAKPFAILRYVPDMTHPEVRERFLDMVAPASAALYGPTDAPKQVGPGLEPPVDRAPAVTSDDVDDVQDQNNGAAGDDDLPAFLRPGGAPAAEAETASAEATLLARIRDTAAAGGLVGGAKDPQVESLRAIFTPLGGRATVAGIEALWPGLAFDDMTANQAQAIIGVSRTFESDATFQAAWRAMAGLE